MLSELSHFPTDNIERVTADMAAKEKNSRSRRAETVSNSIHGIMSAGYYVGFITVFIIPAVVYFVAYFRQIDPTLVDEGGRLIGLVYDFRYPIVFSSVVAALLFVIRWRRRETTRRRETARAAREFSRQFLKTHHEIMLQLMQKNSEDKDLSEDKSIDDFAVILNDIQRFIDSSSNLINNYFRHYTGRECHVSVKSYDPDTDLVYRLSRDSLNPSRNEVDEHHREFNPKLDMAFHTLLTDKQCKVFRRNRMKKWKIFGKPAYYSTLDDWSKYFDSVLVASITLNTSPTKVTSEQPLGFLCVDNFGGGFNRREAGKFLSLFAFHYYVIFDIMGRIDPHKLAVESSRRSSVTSLSTRPVAKRDRFPNTTVERRL